MKQLQIFAVVFTVSLAWTAHALEFVESKIPFSVRGDKTLIATLRFPKNRSRTEVTPLLLLFGGFQSAAGVLDLISPKAPIALASFDYPFEAPRKFEFPGSLKLAPMAKETIYTMLAAIPAFLDTLKKSPPFLIGPITFVGASLGAPFVILSSPGLSQVKGVVLVHGFADIPGTLAHQLVQTWTRQDRFGWFRKPLSYTLAWSAWFYLGLPSPLEVAENFRSDQDVLLFQAKNDHFIPKSDREALWNAVQASAAKSKRLEVMEGDHLQPHTTHLIAGIMERVTEWMQSKALLESK